MKDTCRVHEVGEFDQSQESVSKSAEAFSDT